MKKPGWRRRVLSVAIPLALYFVCRALLATSPAGLITPDGSIDFGLAAVGAATLALRLWALFVLPGLVLYWSAGAIAERLARRAQHERR